MKIEKEFVQLLKNMVSIFNDYKIILTAMTYPKVDFEGGLIGFNIFLSENVQDEKIISPYSINWLSGYKQEVISLFDGREAAIKIVNFYMEEEDNNLLKDKEQIYESAYYRLAEYYYERIEKITVKRMVSEDIDNKFYGNVIDDVPIPVDKKNFPVFYDKEKVITVIYDKDNLEGDI